MANIVIGDWQNGHGLTVRLTSANSGDRQILRLDMTEAQRLKDMLEDALREGFPAQPPGTDSHTPSGFAG